MLRTLWKWLAASFSLVVILLAIAIGLFRLLLPTVPQYHQRIEAFASEVAGTPVRIEGIDARWGLAGPQLRFTNAELLTADGAETLLSAAHGSVVIDLGALIRHQEVRAGRVLLDGLRLEVLRDEQDRWLIGGRVLGGGGDVPRRLSIGLREAEVLFRDEFGDVGPYLFEEVDLNVELRNRRLSLDGLLDLPAELGGSLEMSLQADGDMRDFASLDWQVYTDWRALDFSGWSALLPADRVWPVGGVGDAVVWLAMEGNELQQASLQLDLAGVELARDGTVVHELSRLGGRFEFDRIEAGWRASGRDVRVAGPAAVWPSTEFGIEQVGGPDGSGLTYADADYLRLQDLAPLASWLPAGAARDWIALHEPRGVVEDLSLRMTREKKQVAAYSLRAQFSGLGLSAADDWPGFDGISGDVRLDDYGGRLQLDPTAASLHWPTVLGEPLMTRRTNGILVWRRSAGAWRIVSDNVSIDHAAFRSSSSLEVTLPVDGNAPRLDLHSYVSDVDVAAVRALLPRPVLRPQLRSWLDEALVAGRIPAATVNWNGAIDRFPFDDGSGEFNAIAEFEDLDLAYARNWPAALGLDGTISFRNAALAAEVRDGEVAGNRVTRGKVSIADLREAVLRLDLGADGSLERLHGFLTATPLVAGDNPLTRMRFGGSGSVTVDVSLPLKKRPESDVVVDVTTADGSIMLDGLPYPLEKIAGSLRYRNGDLFGDGIDALLLGAPIEIEVHPETLDTSDGPRRAIVATGRGVVSDSELERLDAALPAVLAGSTPFAATLTLPRAAARLPVTVEIATSLEGMAVRLPAPLDKAPAAARTTVVSVALPPAEAVADVTYGDVANARIAWRRTPERDWEIDRGAVQFGASQATLPDGAGLEVSGAVDRLDVDGWLALGGGQSRESDLVSARLRARRLTAFGQEIDDAVITLDRNPREWLVQIDSAVVAGGLFIPFAQDEPVVANMERLFVTTADDVTGEAGDRDRPQPDPRGFPGIDLSVDDFRLGRMELGRLTGRLRQRPDGIVLEELEAGTAAFTVNGSGAWTETEDGQQTRLDLRLDSVDLATTLVALGFDASIDAEDAVIELALDWPGPPGPDFKEKLDGTVSVRVGAGQLQAVQPGAGRVFGLLSFTALPRRLSLDFRDVFDKGFGFDYIEGDFTLDDGNAFTSNLVLEGPAAQVGIAGRTGLVARDYDQTAVVYGNFGAALPVAGAIAGGPVGGAAMLIFSELFKKPLQDMARINYRITGSWDEPEIERVIASGEAGAS